MNMAEDSAKTSKKVKNTVQYEKNQALIVKGYNDFMKKYDRFPTNTELAEITGLTRNTIINHHKQFSVKDLKKEFRTLAPEVVKHVFKASENGNSASQKLAFQVMDILDSDEIGDITINIQLPDFLKKNNENQS